MARKNEEQVYFVTDTDSPTGEVSEKYAAHHSDTRLHAAFSCYVFNEKGEILATKRASVKKVWPNVWTNSCCGHPAPGESRVDAVKRRLSYELGMEVTDIELVLPRYMYKTPPYNGITEHEYCPVYVAKASSEIGPNPEEVSEFKWMSWSTYVSELEGDANDYSDSLAESAPTWSWWCKDQLKQLKNCAKFVAYLKRNQI